MHSEKSVLSAQCNSSALTVCVFLFNVTNNTVIVLLVSSLLILLSILLHLLRFRRPVRLNVRLTRLMFRSDQMSLVVPLCGAIRRLACTDMTWRSLVSTSVRMTRIILMHVPRCGRPACLFSERIHTLSDGERVRWKTSQERKQCSTNRTCDGKLSLNDQCCGRVGMRGQTSQTTCMSAAQQ